MSAPLLFIGEQRSRKAVQMGVHWKDGRLAAKQLFDALKACGLDPAEFEYVNVWEKLGANIRKIQNHQGVRVALGQKVSNFLKAAKLEHIALVHPAARGLVRRKHVYCQHVRDTFVREGIITP